MSENYFVELAKEFKKSFLGMYSDMSENARPWFKYSFLLILVIFIFVVLNALVISVGILYYIMCAIFNPVNYIFKPIGKFIYWIFYKEPERKIEDGQG